MTDRFDDLVAEAEAAPVDGWDFSWLDGRASEQRPSWRYAHAMSERMARAAVALDLQTGGGEVLAGVPQLAARTAATESWQPNLARAAALLRPRRVMVVAADDSGALPFADARAAAEAAGLRVIDLRMESLHTEFRDIGAVIYFLRKVIWIVPGFTVDRHRPQLEALHNRISSDGPFQAHTTRNLQSD